MSNSSQNINGESRLAVTTHETADIGVCLRNHLDHNAPAHVQHRRTIDLDIDIGTEAVDYNAIANQESLSVLEVEMRKLEGVVKDIVDELGYLQRREIRMRDTNGESRMMLPCVDLTFADSVLSLVDRIHQHPRSELFALDDLCAHRSRRLADHSSTVILQTQVLDRLKRQQNKIEFSMASLLANNYVVPPMIASSSVASEAAERVSNG